MKLKKFFAVLMAVVMCVAMLGACSGGSSSDNQQDANNQQDVGDNQASGDKTVVKIGFIGPLTGGTAQYGESVRNAAKMYFEKFNATNEQFTVEFIEMDSEGDSAVAATAYNTLYDQGVVAIVGPVLTGETSAVAELAAEDGMPLVTASATGDTLTDIGDALYRTCFNDSFQGGKMASYAAEKMGVKTVAVMTNTASDYSKGLASAFVEKCAELNIEVVSQESYVEGDTDFMAQLTNLSTVEFDAMYVPDYYGTVALIAQQAKSAGIDVPFLGGDGYSGVVEIVEDTSVLEGFVFTDHYSPEASAEGTDFANEYTKRFGVEPLSFSFLAYDAAMVVADAVTRAESLDMAGVMAAIDSTDLDCLTTHYTFDEDNNPVKECAMRTIENGEYKFVTMF